jgi:hypothetical protein
VVGSATAEGTLMAVRPAFPEIIRIGGNLKFQIPNFKEERLCAATEEG